jgi:hypothetical protein
MTVGDDMYQTQANPRLGQVDEQTILRPTPRRSDLLEREIISVLQ